MPFHYNTYMFVISVSVNYLHGEILRKEYIYYILQVISIFSNFCQFC